MKSDFFKTNRNNIINSVKNNSLLIMFAGKAPKKSADEMYPFTPNRNFYYATGVNEQEVILIISKIDNIVMEKLFIKKADPILEKWVGKTISREEAINVSGVENVDYIEGFDDFLHKTISLGKVDNIYLDLERDSWTDLAAYSENFSKELLSKYPYVNIKNINNTFAQLRMIKRNEEIELIREAIKITNEGIENAMKHSKPGMSENQIEAYFDFTLKSHGVKDFAFKTIAASGKNGTVLHYSENDSVTGENDLILMDLGAQYKYYNADITRTFPVGGRFTDRQKEIYNIVLKAQLETIKAIKPGVPFKELNAVTRRVMLEELTKIGLASTDEELSKYYYHSASHHLGLDTHDVGNRDLGLQCGMVITIEPGLYIEEENIGIRVEDDVLVTESGCEVLSDYIIKAADDIEKFMNNK